MSSCKNSYTGH